MLKIESNFFDCKEVCELRERLEPTNKQISSIILCFIKLLCLCSDGLCFSGSKKLAQRAEASKKAADIVWDFCIEKRILQEGDQGFTAMSWMVARGMVVRKKGKGESEFDSHRIDPVKDLHLTDDQIEALLKKYRTPLNLRIAYHNLWNWALKQGVDPQKINAFNSLCSWVYDRVMTDESFPRDWFTNELKKIYDD